MPDQQDQPQTAEQLREHKDEALVAAYFADGGYLRAVVVAHTGMYLATFTAEDGVDCRDLRMPEPPAPGLWTMRDGRSWGYQDNDWSRGMDGTLSPATVQDVSSFGLDRDALLSRLGELDEDVPTAFWERLVFEINGSLPEVELTAPSPR
jgi:hypothetical protein